MHGVINYVDINNNLLSALLFPNELFFFPQKYHWHMDDEKIFSFA